MVFAAIFKWGCIIAVVMTNPKDPNSPPIPVFAARALSAEAVRSLEVIRREIEWAEKAGEPELVSFWREGVYGVRDDEHEARFEKTLDCLYPGKVAWMSTRGAYLHLNGWLRGKGETTTFSALVDGEGEEALALDIVEVVSAGRVREFAEKLATIHEWHSPFTGGRVVYGGVVFEGGEESPAAREEAWRTAVDEGVMMLHVDNEYKLTVLNPDREKLRAVAP